MALAARGVPLQTDDLVNPSGGRVIIPTASLADAHTITIRAAPSQAPQEFDLSDLPDALRASQEAQCGFQVGGPVQQ